MRVTMIHAIAESIPPVKLAFSEEFPEAEVINVLDEGLLADFDDHVTPKLRRRMSNLIGYCQNRLESVMRKPSRANHRHYANLLTKLG